MPLDHYVTLGRSGLRVSPLCLGAMTFGEDLGWGSSVEESQQIIDRFIELGGNFIDTANFYTKSHSEKIIGDHVGRHPARRDRLVIATKFSGNLYPGDPNGGGSGRKSIIAPARTRCGACKPTTSTCTGCTTGTCTRRSRRRWPRSRISCAPARCATSASPTRPRGRSPRRTSSRASAAGRRSSDCRSSTRCSSAPSSRNSCRWRASSASASRRGRRSRAACSAASTRGRTPARSRPIAASSLDTFLNEKTYAIVDELEIIAKAHDSTVARVALAWVQAQPGVTSTIIGARRLAQLEDNLRARCEPLGRGTGRLDALTKPTLGFPQDMLTMAPGIINGGTTVNGVTASTSEYVMPEGGQPH